MRGTTRGSSLSAMFFCEWAKSREAFPILGVEFAENRGNEYLKFAGEQKTVFSQQKQYVYDGDDLGILCPRGASLGFRLSVLP